MEEFKKKIAVMLQEWLGGEYVIEPVSTLKANDIVCDGITVRKEGSKTGITMYLEGYFDRYNEGRIALSEIVELLVQNVSEDNLDHSRLENTNVIANIADYDAVKESILMKVLNEDKNQEYLKDVVSVSTGLGICVCFYLEVDMQTNGTGSLAVRKRMLDIWGVTPEELYEQAQMNVTRLLPHKFEDIVDLKQRLVNRLRTVEELDLLMLPRNRMYVLSNENSYHGAVSMFYTGLLRMLAEEIGTEHFIILPSSLHEVILLPLNPEEENTSYFREMVVEVNATQIAPSEYLSDNIFHYDYVTDTISIIEEE